MLLKNLNVAMAVFLMATVAGLGVGGLFYQTQAAEPAAAHAALKPVLLSQKAEPVQQQKQDKKDKTVSKKELPERYKQIYPLDDLLIPVGGLPFPDEETGRTKREIEFLKEMLKIEAEAVPFPEDNDDFLKELLRIEAVAVPFPEDEAISKDLGFYPPAKVLLDKTKGDAHRQARKKALAKLQAIAEIEASLKKLTGSTDDKAEREALESIEKAVKQMKEKAMGMVYPVELLKVKEKEDKTSTRECSSRRAVF
jgi:hypothetical protein